MVARKVSRSLSTKRNYVKHAQQPGFDKTRFTPETIANKKRLDAGELKAFFLDNHTLGDCAKEYGCSEVTIKRHLRSAGVDTSIYNHSQVANHKHIKKYRLTDAELTKLFVDDNLDTKTIAEMQNPPVHFNVVRKHVRRLGLKKDRMAVARSMSARHIRQHGTRHPSQRPDVLAKTRRSMARVGYKSKSGTSYLFRSLTELAYALYLDNRDLEWYYEETSVQYSESLTGKIRLYVIDFTVVNPDGTVEWIEVKPADRMIPDDKRLAAERQANIAGVVYRGLNNTERVAAWALVDVDYRLGNIEVLKPKPTARAKQVSYLFKSAVTAKRFKMVGWHRITIKRYKGSLCVLVLRRRTCD